MKPINLWIENMTWGYLWKVMGVSSYKIPHIRQKLNKKVFGEQ
jgi:hypothetical protein